jgi:hypothetical protein
VTSYRSMARGIASSRATGLSPGGVLSMKDSPSMSAKWRGFVADRRADLRSAQGVEPMAAIGGPSRVTAKHQSLPHLIGLGGLGGRSGFAEGSRIVPLIDPIRSKSGSSAIPAMRKKHKAADRTRSNPCGLSRGRRSFLQAADPRIKFRAIRHQTLAELTSSRKSNSRNAS